MRVINLTRAETSDQGTFGRLSVLSLFSAELPERGNAPNKSCIPPGDYAVRWTYSYHLGKYTYELFNVPARAGIRIHSANLMGDVAKGYKAQVLGCIALGIKLGIMQEQKAVLLSRPAVRRFNEFMEQKPFILEVR